MEKTIIKGRVDERVKKYLKGMIEFESVLCYSSIEDEEFCAIVMIDRERGVTGHAIAWLSPYRTNNDLRKLGEYVSDFKAKEVILVHNRPKGDIRFYADMNDEKIVQEVVSLLGAKLKDHIIMTKDECFSCIR